MKLLTTIFLFFITSINVYSQKTNDPAWYIMMQDPKVNYHKAVQSYNDFWKSKKLKPEREMYEMEALLKTMTDDERHEFTRLAIMNREFVHWMQEAAPWVQPDGQILSLNERIALVKKQKTELKEIEAKQIKD